MASKTSKKELIKLSLQERMSIPGILSKEGDFKTIIVNKDLKAKIAITQAEIKKFNFQVKGDVVLADQKSANYTVEYDFTELEKLELKLALQKLDADKKITEEYISLYEKFAK